jgi:predicted nucleic acid-binding protein
MARLVLSDASPLIGLARVDGLNWLRELFGSVGITPEVVEEILVDKGSDDERCIRRAMTEGWLFRLEKSRTKPTYPQLGEGESSCLRAALARREPTLLLLDDRLARREARRAGLEIVGVAAIIGMAEQRGLIPSARAVFATLLQSDFRIGVGIIEAVLESGAEARSIRNNAGEEP